MKTLFIDCKMGAAGDMLSAALLELFEDKNEILGELNALGLESIAYEAKAVTKCSIVGTKLSVKVNGVEEHEHMHHHHESEHSHSHSHNNLSSIKNTINSTNAKQAVKDRAVCVYQLLAEAESKVHNTEIDNIHFHEVGTLDAIADILAFCYLFDKLNIDFVTCTPINVGKGTVHCAHGILPVPAPATAEILKGVPIYSNNINGELCTPTGAALLKTFVNEFSDITDIQTEKIGYGMGTKDFENANCVRVMLGKSESNTEKLVELSFNVDDMTAEEIAFGTEELLRNGAKDVFTSPIAMKKSRLGTLVSVLCLPTDKEAIIALIFRHFSTIGLRETLFRRYIMKRSISTAETKYGKIRRKDAEGYNYKKSKYEYDDLARIARENNCSIREIRKSLENEDEI